MNDRTNLNLEPRSALGRDDLALDLTAATAGEQLPLLPEHADNLQLGLPRADGNLPGALADNLDPSALPLLDLDNNRLGLTSVSLERATD